jgi:hypothetical protein
MIDLHSKADTRLVLGVIAIGVALMETISGEALQRYGKTTTRYEEPKNFWKTVALHYFFGVASVGYYLYQRFTAN